jgi:hypothetical protein
MRKAEGDSAYFPPSRTNPAAGSVANLAFNMWAAGRGTDFQLRPSINLRVDYEFQQWSSVVDECFGVPGQYIRGRSLS